MIRLIIWFILIFIIFKIVRMIKAALSSDYKSENEINKKKTNSKYSIKDEDIIEAKFEDIVPKDSSKS